MSPNATERSILDDLVATLSAAGHLRTWSVIVSVFGDAALSRGSRIPASALGAILAPLGIEPGAMRTALSRLAKDGWIESERSGRTSTYKLTASALSASGIASQAIYSSTRPVAATPPRLMLWPEGTEMPSDPGLIVLRRGVAIWQGGAVPDHVGQDALSATQIGMPAPSWVVAAIAGPDLADQMRSLITEFSPLWDVANGPATLSPVECAAARVALIHSWRRLALRLPGVPDAFLPDDWPEQTCRSFVLDLHSALSVLADPWLDAHLSKAGGAAPVNV